MTTKILILMILICAIAIPCVSATVCPTFTAEGTSWVCTDGTEIVRMWNATGTTTWDTSGITSVRYLVQGGGGGGGGGYYSSGGGAGGYKNGTGLAVSGTETIVVGTGGTAGSGNGGDAGKGGDSSLTNDGTTITSEGGGEGKGYGNPSRAGGNGGSGGGAGGADFTTALGGTASAGYAGGTSYAAGSAGGGGGSASVGNNGNSNTGAIRNGGSGTENTITGTTLIYGNGGHGGGINATLLGTPGRTNFGDGGSAALKSAGTGGIGGSGIVIVRYSAPADTTPPDSITGLTNTTALCTEITWQWTNPGGSLNADYSYLYTLKNDVWTGNYSNSTSAATWTTLSPLTSYNFSSKTVDLKENMNATWVNRTTTTPDCPGSGRSRMQSINHTLGSVPGYALVTLTKPGELFSVSNLTALSFDLTITNAVTGVAGTNQTIYWCVG